MSNPIHGSLDGNPPYDSDALREHLRMVRDPQDLNEALVSVKNDPLWEVATRWVDIETAKQIKAQLFPPD